MRFEEISWESRPCPLGCPTNDELVLAGHDRLYNLPGEFRVVRCRACGLMRTDPRPTPASMSFYYPDTYGPYQATRVSDECGTPTQPSSMKRRLSRLIRRLFETNIDRLPKLSPGRMLEIGCASGSFLQRMAQTGWKVEGIEFSETAARWARALGYPVYAGALEEAPVPERDYDLIVGWMVLEHLHDPIISLRKIYSWVCPSGRLIISTPNASSLALSLFRDRWFALHLPHHLFHYTPQTLTEVLARCGWQAERIFYHRDLSDLVVSLGYTLKDRKWPVALAEKLISFPERQGKLYYVLYPFAYLLSLLGKTGGMTIWARRIDD